jgi:hypothetical protein
LQRNTSKKTGKAGVFLMLTPNLPIVVKKREEYPNQAIKWLDLAAMRVKHSFSAFRDSSEISGTHPDRK